MPSPASAAPAGVGGLLAAYLAGAASPGDVVRAAAAAARADTSAAWLAVATPAAIDGALAALDGRAPADADAPLFGVPFAVKDNIDVAGLPTTAACAAFAYTPDASAAAVRRIVAAGGVVIGKTNLDQFATGLVGTRSPHGAVACAFDARYIGGGSSSGSAAVVARGGAAFALGTDTAGSGRVPAAFQNVVGLKPTPGRVSTAGVVPACRSLDCVSVFALSAADAARVLAVIEAPDGGAGEPRYHPTPVPLGPATFRRRGRALRVGVPRDLVPDMSPAYAAAFRAAVRALDASLGAQVLATDFAPLHAVARLLYDGPWVAERHVVLAPLLARDPAAVEPAVRGVVESAGRFSAADAFAARYRLADLAGDAARIWDAVDLLMVPTAPLHPTLAEVAAEPVRVNAALGGYTNFVNLLGWSALALPAALLPGDRGDLPFGITWIAPAGSDAALLALGAEWQASVGAGLGFGAPCAALRAVATELPPAMPRSEPVLPLAVVGAHLEGMPLHHQLVERRARLLRATTTAGAYRLYALKGATPRKPGLVRVPSGGRAIEVEVYAMPTAAVGSFLALVPPPLGLGSVELADGSLVHSFICEPCGIDGAADISDFGGWRRYTASLHEGGRVGGIDAVER